MKKKCPRKKNKKSKTEYKKKHFKLLVKKTKNPYTKLTKYQYKKQSSERDCSFCPVTIHFRISTDWKYRFFRYQCGDELVRYITIASAVRIAPNLEIAHQCLQIGIIITGQVLLGRGPKAFFGFSDVWTRGAHKNDSALFRVTLRQRLWKKLFG